MSRNTDKIDRLKRLMRATLLRQGLAGIARRLGRSRGHVLRRLSEAVGRLPRPGSLRAALRPITLIDTMPSIPAFSARLGLGLGGGGGGSPGQSWRLA